jgi:hypothetical protein
LEEESEPDESMISETRHQIREKVEAANEKTKRINDELRGHIAEIKESLNSAKSIGQELEKSINERNNE